MELIKQYKYSIVGAIIALCLALIVLSLGFVKTLFLMLIVSVGAVIGGKFKNTGILEQISVSVKERMNQNERRN